MSELKKPRASKAGISAQQSYELPHRIHTVKVYPRTSTERSSVIIYGHSYGIRVIWRGGKSRHSDGSRSRERRNSGKRKDGASANSSFIERPNSGSFGAGVVSSDDELDGDDDDDDDYSGGYFTAVRKYRDIPLGTEVLHLAVPPLPSSNAEAKLRRSPSLFDHRIVIAAACSDASVRVISLALDPYLDEAEEDMAILGGMAGHQGPPSSVAVTWTVRSQSAKQSETDDTAIVDDDDDNNEDDADAGRDRMEVDTVERAEPDDRAWDLLVASSSDELSGTISLMRIPLDKDNLQQMLPREPIMPYRTLYVRSPVTHLSLCPSTYPSRLHSRLLVTDRKGYLRIFEMANSNRGAKRRTDHQADSSTTELGSWVASAFSGFGSSTGPCLSNLPAQGRRVLGADWTSDGNSIVLLLADGEWAVWDVTDSATPAVSSRSATDEQTNFALHGFVGASTSTDSPGMDSGSSIGNGIRSAVSRLQNGSGEARHVSLAPMTPNTRKEKGGRVFNEPRSALANGINGLSLAGRAGRAPRGGVTVSPSLRSSYDPVVGTVQDDTVVIWYEEELHFIASLRKLRQSGASTTHSGVRARGVDSGSVYNPALHRLNGLVLGGEICNGISQSGTFIATLGAKAALNSGSSGSAGSTGSIQQEIVVAGEHRLIFYSHPALHQVTIEQPFQPTLSSALPHDTHQQSEHGQAEHKDGHRDSAHTTSHDANVNGQADGKGAANAMSLDKDVSEDEAEHIARRGTVGMDVDRQFQAQGDLDLTGLDRMIGSMSGTVNRRFNAGLVL